MAVSPVPILRRARLSLVLLLALLGVSLVQGQPAHYGSNIQSLRSTYLQARQALDQGQRQQFQQLRAELQTYPLLQYLDYADLSRRLGSLPFNDVEHFLNAYGNSYLGNRLRREWLTVLADNNDWESYLQYFDPDNTHTVLSCHAHRARIQLGDFSQMETVRDLWDVARSQPNECDPVFETWMAAGHLTPDIAWSRFSKTLAAGNRSLARYISTLMPVREQQLADLFLRIDSQPERLRSERALDNDLPEIRQIVLHGVRRLAAIDAPQANLMLHRHHENLQFSAQEMIDAQRFIAMRLLVQGFSDETESLLRNTPDLATETLVAWLLRSALRDQDWPGLLRLLDYLPSDDRQSERWRYWQARALAETRGAAANNEVNAIYRELAGNRSFYGFMAADLLGQPYTLTDQPVSRDPQRVNSLYDLPAIVRAHELFHVGDEINARNEWQHATLSMDADQVAASGVLARDWGWHRNTIQAMIRLQHWDDLELRFPLAYGDLFSSAAGALDVEPQLLYAVTRQESAFMEDVRSPAGAMGLMQLMPATAREVAQGVGLRISNQDLYNPDVNISLGSHYLARLLSEFDGNRILAAAAYNAGPNRVNQWLRRSQDNPLPVDVWIETIPFAETRGYVQNVLVYAVIYGHLMGQPTAFMLPHERRALQ